MPPMPGDQWNGLQVRINQCNAIHKLIFVGETGIKPSDVGGALQARADALDAKLGGGASGARCGWWLPLPYCFGPTDMSPGWETEPTWDSLRLYHLVVGPPDAA